MNCSPERPPVWCEDGRWGPRRVRVSECWGTILAEDVYTALVDDDPTVLQPRARGSVERPLGHRSVVVEWRLRDNALWRSGRVLSLIRFRGHVPKGG